ncbi:MAG: YeeE/YedE family protein [Planctomycetes bacterium]|nr:YeeE/YedE family protein [Planctomycetota bacterium]
MNSPRQVGIAPLPGAKPYLSPYLAGLGLGLVLLFSFLVLGKGLGASGGFGRMGALVVDRIAPEHIEHLEHARGLVVSEVPVLKDGLVFALVGVAIGGFLSALSNRRVATRPMVERGPTTSLWLRLTLALVGGVIMGFAARMGRGCTSGQALSGGALLSLGSWAFMMSVFAGGFGFAWFVRRQWR